MKMKGERQPTRFSCSISRRAFTTFPAIWNGGERRFQLHEIRHGHFTIDLRTLSCFGRRSSARSRDLAAFSRFPFRAEDSKFRRRGFAAIVSSNFMHDTSDAVVRKNWNVLVPKLMIILMIIFFFLKIHGNSSKYQSIVEQVKRSYSALIRSEKRSVEDYEIWQ